LTGLTPEALQSLKELHSAFLRDRLVSEAAKRDWIRAFREGYTWALTLRVDEVLTAEIIANAARRVLADETFRRFALPLFRDISKCILHALRSERMPVGAVVSDTARTSIDALLQKPEILPEHVVRAIVEHEAVSTMLRDVLYQGLRQFNDTANPFFADWGLPAIVKRMPFGGGALLKSFESMRDEFDKRLEPEIRSFLNSFSKTATATLSGFVLSKSSDPRALELRRHVAALLYTQSMADLLAGVDDAAEAHIVDASAHIADACLAHGHSYEQLRTTLATWLHHAPFQTFAQWLGSLGINGEPPLDAIAEELWPHVRLVLGSPIAQSMYTSLTAEFYDSLIAQSNHG